MARRDDEQPLDPELEQDLAAMLDAEGDLGAQLVAAREEAGRNLAAAQHWQAEFENYRKRQAAQAIDQANRASERVVESLLPVIDNLDRAIEHAGGAGESEHLLKGVTAVRSQLLAVLDREGVEPIEPLGAAFDPNEHHAVSQTEDASVPEHTVLQVLQPGYRMHGRVLRPAMVVVSSGGKS